MRRDKYDFICQLQLKCGQLYTTRSSLARFLHFLQQLQLDVCNTVVVFHGTFVTEHPLKYHSHEAQMAPYMRKIPEIIHK